MSTEIVSLSTLRRVRQVDLGQRLHCGLAAPGRGAYKQAMGRPAIFVPYALAMVTVVVAVDLLFFRHQPWLRLAVNVGIVLVFGAFYLRFLRHP